MGKGSQWLPFPFHLYEKFWVAGLTRDGVRSAPISDIKACQKHRILSLCCRFAADRGAK